VEQNARKHKDEDAWAAYKRGELFADPNWKSVTDCSRKFIIQAFLLGEDHPTVTKLQNLQKQLGEKLKANKGDAEDVTWQLVLGQLEDRERAAKFRRIEESGSVEELRSALDSEMGINTNRQPMGNGHVGGPGANGHASGSLDMDGLGGMSDAGMNDGGMGDGASNAGGDVNSKDNGFEDALEKIRLSKMRGKKDTMPQKVATSTAARLINDMIKCYDKDLRAINAEKFAT